MGNSVGFNFFFLCITVATLKSVFLARLRGVAKQNFPPQSGQRQGKSYPDCIL